MSALSEILDLFQILLKEQLKEKSEKQIPQRNDQSHRRKCEFCGRSNHNSEQCYYKPNQFEFEPCEFCGRTNHYSEESEERFYGQTLFDGPDCELNCEKREEQSNDFERPLANLLDLTFECSQPTNDFYSFYKSKPQNDVTDTFFSKEISEVQEQSSTTDLLDLFFECSKPTNDFYSFCKFKLQNYVTDTLYVKASVRMTPIGC